MSKEKPKLDEAGRVTAAMTAAGRSARVAEHFPAKYRQQLAALCSVDGVCVPDIRTKVITIVRAVGLENKATIDDTEIDE